MSGAEKEDEQHQEEKEDSAAVSPNGRMASLTSELAALRAQYEVLPDINVGLVTKNNELEAENAQLDTDVGEAADTIEQQNDALAAKAAGSTLAAIHAKAEFLSGETIRGAIAIAAGIE